MAWCYNNYWRYVATVAPIGEIFTAIFTTDGILGTHTGEMCYAHHTLPLGVQEAFFQQHVNFKSITPEGAQRIPLNIRTVAAGGGAIAYVYDRNGVWALYWVDVDGGHTTDSTIPVQYNKRQRINLHIRLGAGTGLYELQIDGQPAVIIENVDNVTPPPAHPEQTRGPINIIQAGERWYTGMPTPSETYIDSVVVADTPIIPPPKPTPVIPLLVIGGGILIAIFLLAR